MSTFLVRFNRRAIIAHIGGLYNVLLDVFCENPNKLNYSFLSRETLVASNFAI